MKDDSKTSLAASHVAPADASTRLPSETAASLEASPDTSPRASPRAFGETPAGLLRAAERLASDLAAASRDADRERRLPFAAMRTLRASGLVALRVPLAYGGAGGSWEDVARMYILLASGDANVAQAFLSHTVFIERLLLMGNGEQRQRLLPMASSGTLFGGAAAERGGPFRGEVNTRLRADGENFRLHGEKHYSTGALFADFLKIRALDPDGKLVAVLLPADSVGIERVDDWDGMGQRLTASGTTILKDVLVHARDIMPMAPWMTRRHHTGAAAQIMHCAIEVGIALAALRDAIAWSRDAGRTASGERRNRVDSAGNNDPYVLRELGRLSARTYTAQALVLRAARSVETAAAARFAVRTGDASADADADADTPEADALALRASILTAQAKIVSTETALDVTQALYDVCGAGATARRHNLDRHWRNARTHTTHDPVAYKCRAVGNDLVNAIPPPLTFSY